MPHVARRNLAEVQVRRQARNRRRFRSVAVPVVSPQVTPDELVQTRLCRAFRAAKSRTNRAGDSDPGHRQPAQQMPSTFLNRGWCRTRRPTMPPPSLGNRRDQAGRDATPVYYGAIGVMNVRHMYCPARRNSLPTCIIGALRAAFRRLGDWRERLWGRRQLARLDGRLLADIGLTRADVDRELAKRFWRA